MGAAKEEGKGRVREARTRPCDYLMFRNTEGMNYSKSALVTEVTVPVEMNSSMVSA